MRVHAIVPARTLSRAKSRLALEPAARERLCGLMLREVLRTLASSPDISSVAVVSGDDAVHEIARRAGAAAVRDGESGVNAAVAAAEAHPSARGCDATLVVPQDVPFMTAGDVAAVVRAARPPACAVVVPSRRLDGTNALLRMPPSLMGTHYDEDSYLLHLREGRRRAPRAVLALVRRVMMDVDDAGDLRYCLRRREKPGLCDLIEDAVGGAAA